MKKQQHPRYHIMAGDVVVMDAKLRILQAIEFVLDIALEMRLHGFMDCYQQGKFNISQAIASQAGGRTSKTYVAAADARGALCSVAFALSVSLAVASDRWCCTASV